MNRQHIGDSIMRAAIVLAGTLLFFSSALFADSTGGAASKPVLVAVAKVSSSQAAGNLAMNAVRGAADGTHVKEGSLEPLGGTGFAHGLIEGKAARKAGSASKA